MHYGPDSIYCIYAIVLIVLYLGCTLYFVNLKSLYILTSMCKYVLYPHTSTSVGWIHRRELLSQRMCAFYISMAPIHIREMKTIKPNCYWMSLCAEITLLEKNSLKSQQLCWWLKVLLKKKTKGNGITRQPTPQCLRSDFTWADSNYLVGIVIPSLLAKESKHVGNQEILLGYVCC